MSTQPQDFSQFFFDMHNNGAIFCVQIEAPSTMKQILIHKMQDKQFLNHQYSDFQRFKFIHIVPDKKHESLYVIRILFGSEKPV